MSCTISTSTPASYSSQISRAGGFQFVVMQDGVEGDEHPGVEQVGEFHQLGNLRHAVAGVVARAEAGAADVYGVGAMQDGFPGDRGIAGRG